MQVCAWFKTGFDEEGRLMLGSKQAWSLWCEEVSMQICVSASSKQLGKYENLQVCAFFFVNSF